ncbi:MAG: histidine triad nucleotide-binding protein [Betaproteobacteria bacterium]
MHADPNCIFCKIAAGQIPSKKAYEDAELIAFHDINPWAPVHVLIVPKEHIATLADVTPAHDGLLGRMLGLAPRLMRELGVSNGFRTIVNTGADGGQEVWHLHMHVIGGPRPWKKG